MSSMHCAWSRSELDNPRLTKLCGLYEKLRVYPLKRVLLLGWLHWATFGCLQCCFLTFSTYMVCMLFTKQSHIHYFYTGGFFLALDTRKH
jgi:hypothetical protein